MRRMYKYKHQPPRIYVDLVRWLYHEALRVIARNNVHTAERFCYTEMMIKDQRRIDMDFCKECHNSVMGSAYCYCRRVEIFR